MLNNFTIERKRPKVGDPVSFEIRPSDTIARNGLAVLQNGLFLGWIKEGDSQIVQGAINEHGDAVRGLIVQVEDYQWTRGGGRCRRGLLRVTY